jgi:hypothetical protein
MFPPRLQRIADSLAEVAEAMLRPEEPVDRGAADDPPHPHRQPLRSSRTRRAGVSAARPQHCVSPIAGARPAPATALAKLRD